jgi:hypothetical protein
MTNDRQEVFHLPDFPALALQKNFHMQVLTDKRTKLEGRQPLSCQCARLPVATHKAVLHDNGAFRALVPMTMRSLSNCATASHAEVRSRHNTLLDVDWLGEVGRHVDETRFFPNSNMHQLLCQANP